MKVRTQLSRYEEAFDGVGQAFVVTNSERSSMMCPRFWALEYVQNVKTTDRAQALSYGVIVHRLLELILKDVQITDKLPSVERLIQFHRSQTPRIIAEEAENGSIDQDATMTNIERSFEGWRPLWAKLLETWKIKAVELDLIAPILRGKAGPYVPQVPIIKIVQPDGSSYSRPARLGELHKSLDDEAQLTLSDEELELLKTASSCAIGLEEIPMFIAGRVDVLLVSRSNPKELAILDHKTTGSLWKYTKSAPYDVQLPTYAYLIEHGTSRGVKYAQDGEKVTKVIYDLLHSSLPDLPQPLKSGKFSSRTSCPSWLFIQALDHNGADRGEYEEKIEDLRLCDTKYFDMIHREIYPSDVDRIGSELYGVAKNMIRARNSIAHSDPSDPHGLDQSAPRAPHQCVLWGSCKFSTNCLDNNSTRVIIEERPKLFWASEPETNNQHGGNQ